MCFERYAELWRRSADFITISYATPPPYHEMATWRHYFAAAADGAITLMSLPHMLIRQHAAGCFLTLTLMSHYFSRLSLLTTLPPLCRASERHTLLSRLQDYRHAMTITPFRHMLHAPRHAFTMADAPAAMPQPVITEALITFAPRGHAGTRMSSFFCRAGLFGKRRRTLLAARHAAEAYAICCALAG